MIHAKVRKNTAAAMPKIRVVKKGAVSSGVKCDRGKERPKKEVARQLVATVMTWISDFETRKIEETRLAVDRFQHM
jgi:hypothetical protein